MRDKLQLCHRTDVSQVLSVADPGEEPGGPGPTLFLDQTETAPPPTLSKGLDDRPPPPTPSSQGLDPALIISNTYEQQN